MDEKARYEGNNLVVRVPKKAVTYETEAACSVRFPKRHNYDGYSVWVAQSDMRYIGDGDDTVELRFNGVKDGEIWLHHGRRGEKIKTTDAFKAYSEASGKDYEPMSKRSRIGTNGEYITVRVPADALEYGRYGDSKYPNKIYLPEGQDVNGIYFDVNNFNVTNHNDGTASVKLFFSQHDSRGKCIWWPYDGMNGNNQRNEYKFTAEELADMYDSATEDELRQSDSLFVVPDDAVSDNFDSFKYVRLPDNCAYAGKHIYIPNKYVGDPLAEGKTTFKMPAYHEFLVDKDDGGYTYLSAARVEGYMFNPVYNPESLNQTDVNVNVQAFIKKGDFVSSFRMPADGNYVGYVYGIPNSYVEDAEPRVGVYDRILHLPGNLKVTAKNPLTNETVQFTPKELAEEIAHKQKDCYDYTNFFKNAVKAQKKENTQDDQMK